MSLVSLDHVGFLALLDTLLGPAGRQVLGGDPRLSPWLPILEELRDALRAFAPPEELAEASLRALDLRGEGSLAALRLALQGVTRWLMAQGRDEEAARWSALEARLFPRGLALISASYRAQIAEARQLTAEARKPEHADLIARLALGEASGAALLDTIDASHQALEEALQARDAAALERATRRSDAPSFGELRRRAMANLTQLRDMVQLVLPPAEAAVIVGFYP